MIKALILAALTASPALATTQDDVLSAQILPGWKQENGHHMAGISLQLAPNWKTYWRSPGAAGIPPLFNWSGSKNVKSVRVLWPSPQVFHTNGMQTIGYHDGVVLPLEVVAIDPSQPVSLRAQVDLGVCNEICMPAAVEMAADLGMAAAPDAAIKAALRRLPERVKAAKIACEVAPIADGLRLTAQIDLPQRGGETLVFELADSSIWVGEAVTARSGGRLTSAVDLVAGNGAPFALDRSGVLVTVLGGDGALEIAGCPAP
jgi:DsbC/DsbD-like thiol-disulfide interchange protein